MGAGDSTHQTATLNGTPSGGGISDSKSGADGVSDSTRRKIEDIKEKQRREKAEKKKREQQQKLQKSREEGENC